MAVDSPPRREASSGPRGPKRQHRKVCAFCVEKIDYIDYKEISRLRRFISDRGKILPRRVTGTCAKHQRPHDGSRARPRDCFASIHNRAALNKLSRPPKPITGARR